MLCFGEAVSPVGSTGSVRSIRRVQGDVQLEMSTFRVLQRVLHGCAAKESGRSRVSWFCSIAIHFLKTCF